MRILLEEVHFRGAAADQRNHPLVCNGSFFVYPSVLFFLVAGQNIRILCSDIPVENFFPAAVRNTHFRKDPVGGSVDFFAGTRMEKASCHIGAGELLDLFSLAVKDPALADLRGAETFFG